MSRSTSVPTEGLAGPRRAGHNTALRALRSWLRVLTRNCSFLTSAGAFKGIARSTCSTLLKAARALTILRPKPASPSQGDGGTARRLATPGPAHVDIGCTAQAEQAPQVDVGVEALFDGEQRPALAILVTQWVATQAVVTADGQRLIRVRPGQQVGMGGGIEQPARALGPVVLQLGTQALVSHPPGLQAARDRGRSDQGPAHARVRIHGSTEAE